MSGVLSVLHEPIVSPGGAEQHGGYGGYHTASRSVCPCTTIFSAIAGKSDGSDVPP